MADDFKTLREVGIAMGGVRDQLRYQLMVFSGVFVVALAVTGFFYNKLDTLEDRVASFDARFDSIDKRLNDISTKLEAINDRMTKAETDPLQLLARAGLSVNSDFTATSVNGTLYVLPKTGEAMMELNAAGYERTQITPFLEGWRPPAPK